MHLRGTSVLASRVLLLIALTLATGSCSSGGGGSQAEDSLDGILPGDTMDGTSALDNRIGDNAGEGSYPGDSHADAILDSHHVTDVDGDQTDPIADAGDGQGGDADNVEPPACASTWTVLIYMAADNNLEKQGMDDLGELLNVPASECVHMVVQVDRILAFYELGLATLQPWMTTKRIEIEGGVITEIADLGEVNAGDPTALSDFIQWGMATFPADKTALVLWDHGNAWQGYGVDDSSDKDRLSLAEVFQALQQGTKAAGPEPITIIGFDACLMADYANLLGMKAFTRYLIASEEFVPGHGWDYKAFGKLAEDPTMSPVDLGKVILAAFEKQAKVNNTVSFVTLALFDLHAMTAFEAAMTPFLQGASAALVDSVVGIGEARAGVLEFGSNSDPGKSYHMIDVGHLASLAAQSVPEMTDSANAVLSALQSLVITMVKGKMKASAQGVSIYYPSQEIFYLPAFSEITSLSTWDGFLHSYFVRQAEWNNSPTFEDGVSDALDGETPASPSAPGPPATPSSAEGDGAPADAGLDTADTCESLLAGLGGSVGPDEPFATCLGNTMASCPSGSTPDAPVLTDCTTLHRVCGSSWADAGLQPGNVSCRFPQGHAQVSCGGDGSLTVEGYLDSGSAEVTSEVFLYVGFFRAEDETIRITGRVEALLHKEASHVIGTWNQRVVTLVQGALQRPLYSESTESGGLAFHEIPMLYTEPDACALGPQDPSVPCLPDPGALDTFKMPRGTMYPASWLVTTNRVTGQVLGANMYVQSPGGWGEMIPIPGSRLWPISPRGNPYTGWSMEVDDEPVQVDPASKIEFRSDTIDRLPVLDRFGEPVSGSDGRPSPLSEALGYSHFYVELNALDFAARGDRIFWVQSLDSCVPTRANWCTETGEVPDCLGECRSEVLLFDAVCDDGTNGADFNCAVYGYDQASCELPDCPYGDGRIRDCNLVCAAVPAKLGDGVCNEGGAPGQPDLNCERFAWDAGDCPCGDNCSNHGECVAGACVCESGWLPPYCALPSTCGDGTCAVTSQENCRNCEVDCGECPITCGDGVCKPGNGENCSSCPADCSSCSCGDGACTIGQETCADCPDDCGACPVCGDTVCSKWSPAARFPKAMQENCGTCANDCGACRGPCCLPSDTIAGKALNIDGAWPFGGGCEQQDVSECVCAIMPACCDSSWTTACASIGRGLCGLECLCGWLPAGSDPSECDDGDLCTIDSCEPGNGQCANSPINCDDGVDCTLDTCKAGICRNVPNAALCNDDDVCTVDYCDISTGCVHVMGSGPCDDGNACTKGDSCKMGSCQGTASLCDDANVCTDDFCDPATGLCGTTDNERGCNDNDACTVDDGCVKGKCSGKPKDCDDGNPCTADSCDSNGGVCKHEGRSGTACDDGDACTTGDICKNGVCMVQAADCNDGNKCTDDGCSPVLGCTHTNNSLVCDDGSVCTTGDKCASGICGGAPISCDDGNQCTKDSCDAKTGCAHVATGGACDDSDPCTVGDTCNPTSLECHGKPKCVSGDCEDASCDASGKCLVTPRAEGSACRSDSKACTEDECRSDDFATTSDFRPSAEEFFDVSGWGVSANLFGDNEFFGPLPLGFTIDFGGVAVSEYWVSTNGVLAFDGKDPGSVNKSPKVTALTGAFLAPYWDDLEVKAGVGDIMLHLEGFAPYPQQRFIQWTKVNRVGHAGENLTFQVVIRSDGLISYRYQTIEPAAAQSATVAWVASSGIAGGGTPTSALFSHDTASLTNGMSLVVGAVTCTHVALSEGASCGLGNVCEVCTAGVCTGPCDDANPLTSDACNPQNTAEPCVHSPAMAMVPAGTFQMGCNPALDNACKADELPQHKVTVSHFGIDVTEVTVDQYMQCVYSSGCSDPGAFYGCTASMGIGSLPVTCVDWSQANDYCDWIGKRLCDEAEWEMAARGSCELPDHRNLYCPEAMGLYPWGNDPPSCENVVGGLDGCSWCGDSGCLPQDAGWQTGDLSPYGVHDLAGNVAEWMGNPYKASYTASPGGGYPSGDDPGDVKAVRGGSYVSGAGDLRASHRARANWAVVSPEIGFRCCATNGFVSPPVF